MPLEKLNYQDALSLATRIYKAWEVAKANIKKAQERMIKSTGAHRRPINWQVGDKVYLSIRNLKNYRPSYKLAS